MKAISQTFRSLLRRRAFSGLALGLIALATTATVATFAVVRATLWRDLPYRDPATLVNIYSTEPVNRDSTQQMASSAMMLARFREATRGVSGVEGSTPVVLSVAGDGNPEALTGATVTSGLFDLLGTPPAVGRSFRREEETATSGVIIISDGVARRRFGSPESALGKTLTIEGEPRAVVGVMPAGFSLLFQGGDAWIPLDVSLEAQARVRLRTTAVYGRLRPGTSLEQARAALATIQQDISAAFPNDYAATRAAIRPLREALFGNRRPTMLVLGGAVALMLLIAIVSVANLTLADVLARRTLTMTRIALGASPASLIGARMREMSILATVAAAVALLLCAMLLAVLASISPEPFIPLGGRWVDASVVIAAWLAAIVVAFCGALAAVVVEARTRAHGIAGTVSKAGTSGDRRLQLVLSAAQSLVTVVLLSTAVLLGRDLVRLMSAPTGFSADDVLVVRMNVLSRERGTVPARAQYAEALVRGVRAVPGVTDVSAIQSRFVLNETMQSLIDVEGVVASPGQVLFSQIRHVMPNVARVLGVRVLSGRAIDSTDRAESRLVAVVSASFAKKYWPGESAIGRRVRRGAPGSPWLDVVGIVEDVNDAGLGVPLGPTLYVSYLQQNTATARVTLIARTRGASSALTDAVRRAIWSVSASQAIDDITPLPTLMTRSAAQPRFRAAVVGVFSVSAVALVLAGVYAITLFGVLARRRELGIRAAIGASPASLAALATRNSLTPVVIGGVAGTLLTVPTAALTREIIQSRPESFDLFLSFGAVILLIVVAGAAALVPARRAATVSPTEAIRAE